MRKTAILLSAFALAVSAGAAQAQTNVRVAWCAKTVSSAAAPYAIATKMGWFAKAGTQFLFLDSRLRGNERAVG